MEWFYADESDQQIPFQEENFKSLIEAGNIKPDTLVWNASMPDWKQASLAQPMLFGPAPVAATPTAASAPPAVGGPAAPPAYQGQQPQGADGLGIASMVCGILAILMSCGYGIGVIPGIAAIICGHMSRKKMLDGGPQGGSSITMAGLVMGYIGTAISLIMGIVMIAAIIFAISAEATATP